MSNCRRSYSPASTTSLRLTFIKPADNIDTFSERPGKEDKPVERHVISTFKTAQGLGFKGDYHAWEHFLGIHE